MNYNWYPTFEAYMDSSHYTHINDYELDDVVNVVVDELSKLHSVEEKKALILDVIKANRESIARDWAEDAAWESI